MVSKPSRIVYHLVLLTLSDKELNKIQYICILYILKNGDENSLSKCGAAEHCMIVQYHNHNHGRRIEYSRKFISLLY